LDKRNIRLVETFADNLPLMAGSSIVCSNCF
jgi:hypothetical protein